MPSNWRGVAERGDKARSRGDGGGAEEGRPVKLEDTGADGTLTLSEPQLRAQGSVYELITFGHVLCSLDQDAPLRCVHAR